MIEYVNLFILLVMFGSTFHVYYRLKKIFYLISIVMDSEILEQLTNLGRDVDSKFPKANKTNNLILNLTPENVTQHSRIVTTTCKGSSTPTKMSKIIG